MNVNSHFAMLVAAAEASKFSFDGGPDQWWSDVFASALTGLALIPFAALFVWGIHRTNLDRWIFVTAVLATIVAVITSSLFAEFVAPIFLYVDQALRYVGVGQFMIYVWPSLLVCFVGSMILAWRLKRNRIECVEGTRE